MTTPYPPGRKKFRRGTLSYRGHWIAEALGEGGWAPAFTLLELAVVIFIIGLITAIAMPYLGSVRRAQLASQARRLAGRASYLFDEAQSRKLVLKLTFDLEHGAYFVSELDPYSPTPQFTLDQGSGFSRVKLPYGIAIRDVTVQGLGTFSKGTASTLFYPDGYVDATTVHLVDRDGLVFTLSFNPVTGSVAIIGADVSPQRAAQASS